MALTSAGLTNGGVTTHYRFQYDDSLSAPINPGGPEPARTNAVIAGCETDFTLMAGWFGNIALDVNFTIPVNVTQNGGGASWSLGGGNLTVTINPSTGSASFIRYLLVAEMVEQYMRAQGLGWYGTNTEGSEGEGLSRFLSAQFWIGNGFGNPPSGFANSNSWLSSPRADFVNNINLTDDGPDAITGCATLFIWYLSAQLGFSINQIVAAGAPTLGGVYRNLTGDTADPFPFFKQLMDTAFPGTATITSGNLDNPFPLGILSFWVDKSSYGRDEVTDVIASGSNGSFPNAFWLVLEGFNRNQFNALAIGTPALSGAFRNLPGIALTIDPVGVEFETLTNGNIPQRIRFPFDVRFASSTLGSFPAAGNDPVFEVLNATVSGSTGAIPGAAASAEFELVSGADPYYTNINPGQNNDFWLSQDLRVFTAIPGINAAPVAGAPAFASDSFGGAYSYIQNLLAFLNNPANGFTGGSSDPFTNGTIPSQGGALTGDSSVSRFHIQFPQVFNTYNFAVARVRLRGPAASQAQQAKVFFRLWSTQTADTGFDPGSTYLSHVDSGHPHWPLPAPDSHSIPFFATGNSPNLTAANNPEYGTGGVNNQTVTVGAGGVAWAYFGCFLNIYDPANVVNGSAVQALLTGTHHCLVAEIAYDDAPIVNANGIVVTPESSDKLAQRNLQLTFSDNPGIADTHRVPQTFDLKPGAAIVPLAGELLDYPDELMIDWGQTPPDTVAQIYWPQLNAMNVLELGNRLYGTHLLTASDANTIETTVGKGVTYVPIPPGTTENLAGLLTIDLPTTVVAGHEFDILVRRVATRRMQEIEVARLAEHGGGTYHADAAGGPQAAAAEADRAEDGIESDGRDDATDSGESESGTTGFRGIESGEAESGEAKGETESGTTEAGDAGAAPELVAVAKGGRVMRNWRYVTGTFQVKIPVTTAEVMLRPDEDALAVMKWRLQQMAPSNRWHPVLERYISYVGARVTGLGGNPDEIPPSPDGAPARDGNGPIATSYTGKVSEVLYDCFGRFEGFVLSGCCGDKRAFRSNECGFAEILLNACNGCLLVTVHFERGKEDCIRRVAVHR